MMSLRNLLLAAALVASASARKKTYYKTDMSEAKFAHFPEASEYSGGKIKLDYYTAPSADFNLDFMHHLKATVMRLFNEAIEFTPHMVVLRGEETQCRNPDGTALENFSGGCNFHCMQKGRYCDFASFHPEYTKGRHHTGLEGSRYVEESARRSCIWKDYGSGNGNNLYRYFQYHDAMKGTGCDRDFSSNCVKQVFDTVNFDKDKIDTCMGSLDAETDEKNYVLEREISAGNEPKNVPSLFIEGKEIVDLEGKVEHAKDGTPETSLLQKICNSMPDDRQRPQVCEFCLNWCPSQVGSNFDMNTCLWELKCGEVTGKVNFEKYMAVWKTNHPGEAFAMSRSNGGSTLHVVATLLAVILAAGFTALAVMAIRVWRTKMIIDRYVKEQQAMNKGEGGVYGHRDPTFFPEDNELDLDLEPALQYSDHIHTSSGSNHPPSRANFLPQLT